MTPLSHQLQALARRSARAALSRVPSRAEALRRTLAPRLTQAPGLADSFLSDPVIEGTFPWQQDPKSLDALLAEGLLSAEVIEGLRADAPDYHPYTHQTAAWRLLLAPEPQSVIVASGTGSGKTECFLVPMIQDLVRERDCRVKTGASGQLVGVRALMLYPLNALIESQRKRLQRYLASAKGALRFCLYNGLTRQTVSAETQRKSPEQVLSRKVMRESPAPVLVTNITMLEYIMIRPKDAPILEQSAGKLRWLILDEAHTHVGSAAAELTLLLRRTMRAFAVDPEQVRVVATSATIGSADDPQVHADLRQFLGDLAGQALERVHFIGGRRDVAPWPEAPEPTLPAPDDDNAWASLSTQPAAWFQAQAPLAALRRTLGTAGSEAVTLTHATRHLFGAETGEDPRARARALDLLQAAAHATGQDQRRLLPLRLHLMHRAQPGVWSCLDPACPDREPVGSDAAPETAWPLGRLFLTETTQCACGAPVLPVMRCAKCDSLILRAEEHRDTGAVIAPQQAAAEDDFFELDFDEEQEAEEVDEDEPVAGKPSTVDSSGLRDPVFFTPGPAATARPLCLKPIAGSDGQESSWAFADSDTGDRPGERRITVHRLSPDHPTCPNCGAAPDLAYGEIKLYPLVVGTEFIMNTLVPAVLEFASPHSDHPERRLPTQGRRLLTFSDSRQGTARLALRLQRDSERTWVRSEIWQAVRRHEGATTQPSAEMAETQRILDQVQATDGWESMPDLANLVAQQKTKLAALRNQPTAPLEWTAVERHLEGQIEISDWMRRVWNELLAGFDPQPVLARLKLFSELAARPIRGNTLETMGLVGLRPIQKPASRPPEVLDRIGLNPDLWPDLLGLLLTFTLRAKGTWALSHPYFLHSGTRVRPSVLISPGEPADRASREYAWPQFRGNSVWRRTRVLWMLAHATGRDPDDPADRDMLNELLRHAWSQLRQWFSPATEAHTKLRIDPTRLGLASPATLWLCPLTHRLTDQTLLGLSPFRPGDPNAPPVQCTRLEMPQPPQDLIDAGGETMRSGLAEWIETDRHVADLRARGLWTNLHDRILTGGVYQRHVEHSAQVNASKLRQYEEAFEGGSINVINSSTTMEMGIDIAGVTAIIMTNVPPMPANYRQRVGRAGRRQDPLATALTFCGNTSPGWQVFNTPLWPFEQAIARPHVSLRSPTVTRRHINALCLTLLLAAVDADGTRLTAGGFLLPAAEDPSTSVCQTGMAWLRGTAAPEVLSHLDHGIARLLHGTELERSDPESERLRAADALEHVQAEWREEHQSMVAERDQEAPDSAPRRAIEARIRQLDAEFLLAVLAARGFLPSHGFPTRVVELDLQTWRETKRKPLALNPTRIEDDPHRGKGALGPQRDLSMALREYMPGNDVVVDGRVYRCAGLTRNWRQLETEPQAQDVGALHELWTCKTCGAHGSGRLRQRCCTVCSGKQLDYQSFIRPVRFTVDATSPSRSDVHDRPMVPYHEPRVSLHGHPWGALPDPGLGQIRTSPTARVFIGNRGTDPRQGFTLCLACGRMQDPARRRDDEPLLEEAHTNPRSGKTCDGPSQPFALRRQTWMGYEIRTDAAELQLRADRLEVQALDEETPKGIAASLALALRGGLCRHLGVELSEVRWAVERTRGDVDGDADVPCWSLFVYDDCDGGRGYASQLSEHFAQSIDEARRILECPNDCRAACSACLLTRDSQFRAGLDRHAALARISTLEAAMRPPSIPGLSGEVLVDARPLVQILRAQLARAPKALSLFLDDPELDEDSPLGAAWAIGALSAPACSRVIVVPQDSLGDLDHDRRRLLDLRMARWGTELMVRVTDPVLPGLNLDLLSEHAHGDVEIWGRSVSADGGMVRLRLPGPLPWRSGLRPAPPPSPAATGLEPLTVIMDVGSELDGPIKDFGKRFWSLVAERAPGPMATVAGMGPLSVHYTDRYLKDPASTALLVQVIRALVHRGMTVDRIDIDLATDASQAAEAKTWGDDWLDQSHRVDTLRHALEAAGGVSLSNVTLAEHKSSVPHYRALRLSGRAGPELRILLDQGFGAWRTGYMQFPFARAAREAAVALRTGQDRFGKTVHCRHLSSAKTNNNLGWRSPISVAIIPRSQP